MRVTSKVAEVKRNGNVATRFVACDVTGVFRAFVVVEKSRYLMGTTRPQQVGFLITEYLSRDEFGFQQCEFGDVVRIHDADFLVVGIDGEEVVVSQSDCMAHFEQLDLIRRQTDKQRRYEEAERNSQHEQQKKFAEEERVYNQKRSNYIDRLKDRKLRLERCFKLLRMFPELEIYRAAVAQEYQTQLDLENQGFNNLDTLVAGLQKACESESLNLLRMQSKAEVLWRERQRQIEKTRLAEQKRQDQEKKQRIQEDNERREQARLQAEQEKRAQRERQQEQFLLEQRRQNQVRQEHQLKLQRQERQKYQQELLQAQYATLPTLEELMRRLRNLTNFYSPQQGHHNAFVHQLELLSVGCRRGLSSASRQGNTKGWEEISDEIEKLKMKCLKPAKDRNWLKPEEDEA